MLDSDKKLIANADNGHGMFWFELKSFADSMVVMDDDMMSLWHCTNWAPTF